MSVEIPYSVANALDYQFKNWPTRKNNIEENCSILDGLNKSLDLSTDKSTDKSIDLSEVRNDISYLYCINAYIIKALQQRGFMNMCYYLMLDEVLKDNSEGRTKYRKGSKTAKRSKIAKRLLKYRIKRTKSMDVNSTRKLQNPIRQTRSMGGNRTMKLQGGGPFLELIKKLLIPFMLLGASEGNTGNTGDIARNDFGDQVVRTTLFDGLPSDISDEKSMLQYRKQTAENALESIMVAKPWVLNEKTITIAEGVTPQQLVYFQTSITKTNQLLSSLANEAAQLCTELVETGEDRGIFTNDEYYKAVQDKFTELKNNAIRVRRTADTVQDMGAYGVNAAAAALNAIGSAVVGKTSDVKNINENELYKSAIAEVSQTQDEKIIGQVEVEAYSMLYQTLCRASPRPQFIITTTDDTKEIQLQTFFGNDNTGLLLVAHITTIKKIDILLHKETDKTSANYNALLSLKERITMQKRLIKSSALFAPLDGIFTGEKALQDIIVDSDIAAKKFGQIVSKISEFLPISKADMIAEAGIRQSLNEQKRLMRNQVAAEWTLLFQDAAGGTRDVLLEGVSNAADLTKDVISEVSDLLQNATGEIKNVGENVIEGVGDIGKKGVGKVGEILEVGIDSIVAQWWKIFPALFAFLGLSGATMITCVYFKRAILCTAKGSQKTIPEQGEQNKDSEIQRLHAVLAKMELEAKIAQLRNGQSAIKDVPKITEDVSEKTEYVPQIIEIPTIDDIDSFNAPALKKLCKENDIKYVNATEAKTALINLLHPGNTKSVKNSRKKSINKPTTSR